MSATPVVSLSSATQAPSRFDLLLLLLPGPRFPIVLLAALPAAVVAISSQGRAQQVSVLISTVWFSLVPIALYARWVALALPVVAVASLVVTLAVFPFDSTALVVDAWTSVAMFVLSLPQLGIAGRGRPDWPAQ